MMPCMEGSVGRTAELSDLFGSKYACRGYTLFGACHEVITRRQIQDLTPCEYCRGCGNVLDKQERYAIFSSVLVLYNIRWSYLPLSYRSIATTQVERIEMRTQAP